jgi:hypothetical protein
MQARFALLVSSWLSLTALPGAQILRTYRFRSYLQVLEFTSFKVVQVATFMLHSIVACRYSFRQVVKLYMLSEQAIMQGIYRYWRCA